MDKKSLSVAMLGSRGIPNRYGGFESFAAELGAGLVAKGHQVTVYTVKEHPVKDKTWKGIKRVLIANPESKLGTFGQFIYDFKCNRHSRKEHFDVILHLGYTSDSVWFWFWSGNSAHIVNMDGQEWKRTKYNRAVRAFLRLAERLATVRSKWLVADSPEIEKYLAKKYHAPTRYIAYGARIPESFSVEFLNEWGLAAGNYDLLVGRMEPENNIELAIRAKIGAGSSIPLVIVGNTNQYKHLLQERYRDNKDILFLDAIYHEDKLNSLRHFSRIYIHGHSVGGTNPSLLEAMACGCRIVAHDNPFNRYVLGKDANYFGSADELIIFFHGYNTRNYERLIRQNLDRISSEFNWDAITNAYEKLFYESAGF